MSVKYETCMSIKIYILLLEYFKNLIATLENFFYKILQTFLSGSK